MFFPEFGLEVIFTFLKIVGPSETIYLRKIITTIFRFELITFYIENRPFCYVLIPFP